MPVPLSRECPYPPRGTALLIIDMQRIWLEPGRDPDHPERTADDYFYRHVREQVIPNQQRLLRAARAAGIEVMHTIIQSLTLDGRDRSLDHKLTPIHVAPDDPLALPPAALAPSKDEIMLRKTSSGVFNSTAIDYLLRNLGMTHVVVAGIMTDQCVDMAVRDGADRGFLMTCVEDACAASTERRHTTALDAFGGYCWRATTERVVSRFEELGQ